MVNGNGPGGSTLEVRSPGSDNRGVSLVRESEEVCPIEAAKQGRTSEYDADMNLGIMRGANGDIHWLWAPTRAGRKRKCASWRTCIKHINRKSNSTFCTKEEICLI